MKVSIKAKGILSFLIVLIPILEIYYINVNSLPIKNLGDIALVVIIFVSICMNMHHKKRIGKHYFAMYYAFFFILSLVSVMLRNQYEMVDFVQKWVRILGMVYIIDIVAKNQFDRQVLCKWSVRLALIVSVILFVQVVANAFWGVQIEPYINSKLFSLAYGIDASTLISNHKLWNAYGSWRPSSIFIEPSHFANFILLPLVVSIFESKDLMKDKKALCSSVIITFALFLSESATGILIAVVVWGIYFAKYMKKTVKVRQVIFICAVIALVMIIVLKTDYLADAWVRVETVKSHSGTTGTLRLLQGLIVFSKLPLVAKWFGIGYGNVATFLTENNVTTSFLSDIGNEFMNGFSTVLVSSGIIGFVIYLFIWVRLFFENKSKVNRMAFLVISILFCISPLFYSCTTVMYLVFVRCKNENITENMDCIEDVNVEKLKLPYGYKNYEQQ